MARPAIEKNRYVEAIDAMIADGANINEITATKVQKVVGGQYSRCSQIVDEYLAKLKEKIGEDAEPPMPQWFKDFVGTVAKAAEGTWFRVASEMQKSVQDVTETFENKRNLFEVLKKEHLDKIAELEDLQDKQDAELERLAKENENFVAKNAKLEGELAAKKGELKDLEKKYTSSVQEKNTLAAECKVATVSISQLEKTIYAQTQKIEEMATKLSDSQQINKDLDNRALIAETNAENLKNALSDIRQQLSKSQAERNEIAGEIKKISALKSEENKKAQETIKAHEKELAKARQEIAVRDQKAADQAEQIDSLKLQVAELKEVASAEKENFTAEIKDFKARIVVLEKALANERKSKEEAWAKILDAH